ncbi:MAG TPA: Uma2 family endonuclease [Gemmatimonadaceae bacterium]|jgi:Uma2 family endonuclease|nr:Uma2 family endonuclease [Gemmatimonadaceae bacterium]
MAIESATKRWTRKDLERFPADGNRYEVLDGELLVTPQAALTHQIVAVRIASALHVYCELHGVGVTTGPGAVIFGKNELQPDCEVLPPGSVKRGNTWEDVPCPLLAVEVLSPFAVSRRRDLDAKRKAYLGLGIAVYWVIDHEARRAHVWSGGRAERIVSDVLTWQPDPAVAALEIQLEDLFRLPDSDD